MLHLLFALTVGWVPAAMTPEKPEWFQCKASSDCILGKFICGHPRAVAKKHLKDFDAWVATMKAKCEADIKLPEVDRVTCEKQVCSLEFKVP